jgi:hypothetical protein
MDEMRRPSDDEIMRALCCDGKCAVGPNTGRCHRLDFAGEAARIRALLDRVEGSRRTAITSMVAEAQALELP